MRQGEETTMNRQKGPGCGAVKVKGEGQETGACMASQASERLRRGLLSVFPGFGN